MVDGLDGLDGQDGAIDAPADMICWEKLEGLREARFPGGEASTLRPLRGLGGRRPLYQASLVASFGLHAPASRGPIGGEGGIRTPGTLASTSVFETDPFDHSGTSPGIPRSDSRRPPAKGGKYSWMHRPRCGPLVAVFLPGLRLIRGVGPVNEDIAHEDQDHQNDETDQSFDIPDLFRAQNGRLERNEEGQKPKCVTNDLACVHC